MHNQQSFTPHSLIPILKSGETPGRGLFFDGSRTRRGGQYIENRLLLMCSIDICWNSGKYFTNDYVRIEMKRTFSRIILGYYKYMSCV